LPNAWFLIPSFVHLNIFPFPFFHICFLHLSISSLFSYTTLFFYLTPHPHLFCFASKMLLRYLPHMLGVTTSQRFSRNPICSSMSPLLCTNF
jgi:hypothetical protein